MKRIHNRTSDGTTLAAPPAPNGRPSWSGWLQLSLVGIPIKAYPAVCTSETSHFHQFHDHCGQRIRYAKTCPVHGPVDHAAVVKGYAYGPDQHVFLAPEDLDPLRPKPDQALRLERFVAPDEVDPLLFSGRGLYLAPHGLAAASAYAVLRHAMHQRRRWAIGRMILNCQRRVVLVRAAGGQLVLHVLHHPERLRGAGAGRPESAPGAEEELALAAQLIDAASGAVDWTKYRDETSDELRALVEAKLQGAAAAADVEPPLLPLLEALQRSLAEAAPGEPAPQARAKRRRAKARAS